MIFLKHDEFPLEMVDLPIKKCDFPLNKQLFSISIDHRLSLINIKSGVCAFHPR
jgi:hypothetical protein